MKVRLSCQNVCLSKMKVVAKVCTCCRKPEWTSCQGVHQSVQLSSKITVEVANVSHKRGKSTGGSSFWEPGYRLETGNFVVHTQYGKQLLGALGPIRATLSQSLKPIQSACSPSLWIKFSSQSFGDRLSHYLPIFSVKPPPSSCTNAAKTKKHRQQRLMWRHP